MSANSHSSDKDAGKPKSSKKSDNTNASGSKKAKPVIDKKAAIDHGKVEIDDLFGKLSKKRSELQDAERDKPSAAKKIKGGMTVIKSAEPEMDSTYGLLTCNQAARIVSPDAPVHRFDRASGLPVYKAHLLKVGEGGGTPLCPFDCDCCF
jgi:hypothetical protein